MKQLLGYTNKLTARSGELIECKLSAEQADEASVELVRLINGDISSEDPGFREERVAAELPGTVNVGKQPIHTGSCLYVMTPPFEADCETTTVTLRCRPSMPGSRWQQLIGRWKEGTGWSLGIDEQGLFALSVNSSEESFTLAADFPVDSGVWYELTLEWVAGGTATLEVNRLASASIFNTLPTTMRTSRAVRGRLPTAAECLGIGAAPCHPSETASFVVDNAFDGRIENPALFNVAADHEACRAWRAGHTNQGASAQCLAAWDFADSMDSRGVRDSSPYDHNAIVHNLPTRGVRGSRWTGDALDYISAPAQYAAIHFHGDDLYDCRWETTLSFTVPEDLRSGIYAMHFTAEGEEEYLPFFVAAPRGKPTATLAFMVPTYCYLAYANIDMVGIIRKAFDLDDETAKQFMASPGTLDYDRVIRDHRILGASAYEVHSDESPIHFSSWRRPILNMRPKSVLWTFCADLLFIDWMEARGIDYDIITDDLLDREGLPLLSQYRTVMTGNHPEYPTTRMMDSIEAFMNQGGRFMYMGGNGFYWRTGTNEHWPDAIEVRRGRVGTGAWRSEVGEVHHQFTGEYAGIWRESGRPPQQLFGVGFVAQGNGPSYYRLHDDLPDRVDFIVNGLEGETFGEGGIFGGAAGEEIDKADFDLGTPSHAVVIASSENHGPGMMYVIEEMTATYPLETYQSLIHADVVFFETPNGGAMFATGSMSWCGCFRQNNYDNDVLRITENVLKRFTDPSPFALPVTATR